MSGDKRICAKCIGESFLQEIIASTGLVQDCNYCNSSDPTISMEDLAEHVDVVIDQYYFCTTSDDDYSGEPVGTPLRELMDEEVRLVESAQDDLGELLSDLWFDYSSHTSPMGTDPHFVERRSFAEPLSREWNEMEESLKHEARLNNPKVTKVLEKVFGPILDDRADAQQGVVIETGADQEPNAFYRARVYQSLHKLEADIVFPEKNLGPVPPGQGRAGRMNAQGIPVFYGALDPQVAIAEVRPPVGSHVVVGKFDIICPLRLLNLEALSLVDAGGSKFDPATYDRLMRRDFLQTLAKKLASPVMPEREHESYLITQAVADFLATHERLHLDGILFHSVQLNGTAKGTLDTRNVVLFNKSSKVEHADGRTSLDSDFQLYEYDEDGPRMEPKLVTKGEKSLSMESHIWMRSETYRDSALKLDRDSLRINVIRGVSYTTDDIPVQHRDRTKGRLNKGAGNNPPGNLEPII